MEIDDTALAHLLARAGLTANAEQLAGLKAMYPRVRAMAESVRMPRGHMAEPAHLYVFDAEDAP